jgi:flagellar hook-basal body complex protein FliE
MNINIIVASQSSPMPNIAGGTGGAGPAGSFSSSIKNAIEAIDHQQAGADQAVESTVAGDSPDLHQTMATLQMADLSFQLGLQVRNKAIDAYNQVMQMQV